MKGGVVMQPQKDWLKFVITGRVDDYLRFVDSCRRYDISEGNSYAFYNRCSGNKRDEDRRE